MEKLIAPLGGPGRWRVIRRMLPAAWLSLLLLGPVMFTPPAMAQDSERVDILRKVEAAYLYKFASFVKWPGDAFAHGDSPVVIGVIGDDELAGNLMRMVVGETVNGRPLAVRRLQPDAPPTGVHILFVGRTRGKSLGTILAATQGKPVLVVSDSREAFALGSMVNFVVVDQRLRFEVALKPIEDNGLKLSALMLTAAYRVKQERR